MNDYNTPTLLHAIYRREAVTFLQYVAQISPYTPDADRPLLARLHELANTERQSLELYALLLEKSRVAVPHTGAFPSVFSNYNFVTVRKLLPLLVADHQQGIALLERDAAPLPTGDTANHVRQMLELKKLHLTELQKLQG